jgi:hypothetical protein
MALAKLSDKQVAEIVGWVAGYIADQRQSYRPRAAPLSPKHRLELERFFPPEVLSSVRVIRGQASAPPFYRHLSALGIGNAPSFSAMAAVTFEDVVLHAGALTPRLLFHELVHAVQYRHLGLDGFAERYVNGFLTGGSYEGIPLEKQAYELEARFAAKPREGFSVEQEVSERIRRREL